jgi:uncharacterized damage-inducible protein DinB
MNRIKHIRLLAEYNQWMNAKLYASAMGLSNEALNADRGAFFGSILGTLNHLVVADTIWLQRFASHPAGFRSLALVRKLEAPASLDQILHTGIQELAAQRSQLDHCIIDWTREMHDEKLLDRDLEYGNMKGVHSRKNFFSLLLHFFNHQTHHRGQTTTLLSQAGVDVGITDLLALIPNIHDSSQGDAG